MKITFYEISRYGEKNCKCSKCGKKIKRKRKFYQTLNPWNKNKDGALKIKSEIELELSQSIKKWLNEPEICKKCEGEK